MARKLSLLLITALLAVSILFAPPAAPPAQAQGTTLQCGDIIEDQFTDNEQGILYTMDLDAGDALQLSATSFGPSLEYVIAVFDPGLNLVAYNRSAENAPILNTDPLAATGPHIVALFNGYAFSPYSLVNGSSRGGNIVHGSGVGTYILNIGCTLRDGTAIAPGEVPAAGETAGAEETSSPGLFGGSSSAPAAFTGYGFPGLPAVDFTNGTIAALTPGTPGFGALTPGGGEVVVFTVDAAANDVLDLAVTRLSGNLNLGLSVVINENQALYLGSLVLEAMSSARLTLPQTGTYSVGVFQLDLLPPADPQATAFQVNATLSQ